MNYSQLCSHVIYGFVRSRTQLCKPFGCTLIKRWKLRREYIFFIYQWTIIFSMGECARYAVNAWKAKDFENSNIQKEIRVQYWNWWDMNGENTQAIKNLNGVHCLIFSVKKKRAGTFRKEKINYGLFQHLVCKSTLEIVISAFYIL